MFWKSQQLSSLVLADYVTIIGLAFAVFSLYFSFLGNFYLAGLCILGQFVFDIFDGMTARRFGGGKLGLFLDSFSDFTAIIATVFLGFKISNGGLLFILAGVLFITFAAVRLSFFTTRSLEGEIDFLGLPTVGVNIFIVFLLLLNYYFNLINTDFVWLLYLIFGYGMVADLKIKKIKL